MDGVKEKEEKMKTLTKLIEEAGDEPPVKHKINWLCGKCMNSYSSRNYALKHHKCKKKPVHLRRLKEPPHLKYMLKCRCKPADACQRGERKATNYQRNRERGERKATKCQRSKATCCQRNLGQELSDLHDNGTIRKESLDKRQKDCIQLYHLSLL